MMEERDDAHFLRKVLDDFQIIQERTKSLDPNNKPRQDRLILDSIMFRFVQISENVKSISKEFRNENPLIPWSSIISFRNILVHDYGKVDYSREYEVVFNDVPLIIQQLRMILSD